jgi:hypothetical protein
MIHAIFTVSFLFESTMAILTYKSINVNEQIFVGEIQGKLQKSAKAVK